MRRIVSWPGSSSTASHPSPASRPSITWKLAAHRVSIYHAKMTDLARHDAIAILDFGGQYVHLIATKVRSLGVYAEIREPDDPVESFRPYKGIILSGSPALSAHDEDAGWSRELLDLGC